MSGHEKKYRDLFHSQRNSAKVRKIEFLLTFEQWLKIWEDSGHLHERGRKRGQYVMSRPGDRGPYTIGNVKIVTVTENVIEVAVLSPSIETRAKMAASSGRPQSDESKRKISETKKRQAAQRGCKSKLWYVYKEKHYLFSFDTWLGMWERSGFLEYRGKAINQYCMCRKDATRPFTVENCIIVTNRESYRYRRKPNQAYRVRRAQSALARVGREVAD